MDYIELSGIRAYGYTGFFPEEQVLGQWFEVNLTLGIDLTLAGNSDRLEDTLDYGSAIETTKQIVKVKTFALVEKLAAAIAQAILNLDPRISTIQVHLSKLAAPIPDFSGKIAIDITRSR